MIAIVKIARSLLVASHPHKCAATRKHRYMTPLSPRFAKNANLTIVSKNAKEIAFRLTAKRYALNRYVITDTRSGFNAIFSRFAVRPVGDRDPTRMGN